MQIYGQDLKEKKLKMIYFNCLLQDSGMIITSFLT